MTTPNYIRVNGHLYRRADDDPWYYVIRVYKKSIYPAYDRDKAPEALFITPDERTAKEIPAKYYGEPDYVLDTHKLRRSWFEPRYIKEKVDPAIKQHGFFKLAGNRAYIINNVIGIPLGRQTWHRLDSNQHKSIFSRSP